MSFNPELSQGDEINNSQLANIFKCSQRGGIRPAKTTSSIVIVSNHVKSLYQDRWEEDVLHYIGSGRYGDQTLTDRNKAILEATNKGRSIFLFEVFVEKEYIYRGEVSLLAEPYQEQQLDDQGNQRLVWVFPLSLVDVQNAYKINEETVEKTENVANSRAKAMDNNTLKNRAKNSTGKVGKRTVETKYYNRDPYVLEYAKRWANGYCQLCESPAPFSDKKGNSYLHTHHIEWLSRGGEDTIQNAIALCPNCHEKMHIIDDPKDVKELKRKVGRVKY